MTSEPVRIIGMGAGGPSELGATLRGMVESADELWGGERLLDQWPQSRARKVPFGKRLSERLAHLKERPRDRRIVILASGDPGFYGVASGVLKVLPKEEVLIYPAVSSLQTAFARLRLPWQEAAFTSAHARPAGEVVALARRSRLLGVLTDPEHTPAWIAERLLAAGLPDCRAVVCENLGEQDESIDDARLSELPGMSFSPLNVLVLEQDPGWRPAPAIMIRPDQAYRHRNGLITKRDVRLLCLERLEVGAADVVWDVGAGSGAVSVELAEAAWRGQVFAVEKDAECLACLNENAARYAVDNLHVVEGEAPEALAGLPVPTAVFIGGSGGRLAEILDRVKSAARPGCRVAASFTLLENLAAGMAWMRANGWPAEVTEARFSYGVPTGAGTRLAPANPIFLLSVVVPGEESV